MPFIEGQKPLFQKFIDLLPQQRDHLIFKQQLWRAYEPHLVTYLEDPEAFGIEPRYLGELESKPIITLRGIILSRLEDKNKDFADRRFDSRGQYESIGYGLYWSREDIEEFIENDKLLSRPLTKKQVRDHIHSNICILFNPLHNIAGGFRYHNNPAIDWLQSRGYNFEFVDIKKDKNEGEKKKPGIQFTPPDEVMDNGYMYLTFAKPKVYLVP